jgi:hypothetical protein
MELSVLPSLQASGRQTAAPDAKRPAAETSEQTIKQRFEQLLWSEMLSHAGLEKALTLGGGEAASSFSRYFVEAIAKDLAETHPLGLAEQVRLPSSQTEGKQQEALS